MIEWMGAYMRSTGTYVRGTSVLLVTLAVNVYVRLCMCVIVVGRAQDLRTLRDPYCNK